MNKNILVVDDEPKLLEVVRDFLQSKGYTVYEAKNGEHALALFRQHDIALVLLDLMLPDISGEDVCKRIREMSNVPIIMVTAKSEEVDQLAGLRFGADDYIVKPFSLKVLLARMETILRRVAGQTVQKKDTWQNGDLEINFDTRVVLKRGTPVELTFTEFQILEALVKHVDKVFTRDELLTIAFGHDAVSNDRVIDNHVKNLRHKIEDDSRHPVYVLTVRSVGYRFGGI